MTEQHEPAGLSRRDFIKAGGAGVLAMGVAGALAPGQLASRAALLGSRLAPRSAKSLQVGLPTEPPALDPVKYNDVPIIEAYTLATEPLYLYTAGGLATPLLAAGMPKVSDAGHTWTIPIRRGVHFTNGKQLTSADAAYTYAQVMKPANASFQAPLLSAVSKLETPDSHTLVIKLKYPFSYLAEVLVSIPIVPSNIPYTPTTYASNLVGTGPFKLESWNRGVSINYVRNKDYWQSGKPHLDSVSLVIVPEPASQVAQLADGTLQLLTTVEPVFAHDITGRGDDIYRSPIRQTYFLLPNFSPSRPTSDVNVRLAMAWAVNRARIVGEVFRGYGAPESTNPCLGTLGYDSKLGHYFGSVPDVAKAKKYLSEAPKIKRTLSLVCPTEDPSLVASMTIVADSLESIGLKVSISALGQDAALGLLFAGEYDLWGLSEAVAPAPVQPWLIYNPASFLNLNHNDDPKLAAASLALAQASGPAARRAASKAVQKRCVEYVPMIQLVTSPTLFGRKPSLKGFAMTSPSNLGGLKLAQFS